MANSAKTSIYGSLLAALALVGAQACAHQADGQIAETDFNDDGSNDTARGGGGGSSSGGSVNVNNPTPTAGKGGGTSSSGGKGGSGGSGGGTGGGGSSSDDGGAGGTPDDGGGMPAPDTGFAVHYMASQTQDTSVAISCQFAIRNDSSETVPLSEFTIRYYFTNELTIEPNLQMFWAHLTTGGDFPVTLTQMNMSVGDKAPGADHYFEFDIGDTALMLAPGQQAELAWQSHNGMSQMNLQSNDYSFDATKTVYTAWDHVVLLRNGEPYWGTPP